MNLCLKICAIALCTACRFLWADAFPKNPPVTFEGNPELSAEPKTLAKGAAEDLADSIDATSAFHYVRLLLHLSNTSFAFRQSPASIRVNWSLQVQPKIAELARLRETIHENERRKKQFERALHDHPENREAIYLIDFANLELNNKISKLEESLDLHIRKEKRDANHQILQTLLDNDLNLRAMDANGLKSRYELDSVFYRHESQLSGMLLTDAVDDALIIAFIGSQSGDDWLHNFAGIQRKVHYGDIDWHSGFYDMWSASLGSLSYRLTRMLETRPPKKIICLGHSAGAGMAVLMSYYLKRKMREEIHGAMLSEQALNACEIIHSVTFGGPPVVNQASAATLERTLGRRNLIRFVYIDDPICGLRFTIGDFKHVGLQVTLENLNHRSGADLHALSSYNRALSTRMLGDFYDVVLKTNTTPNNANSR